MSMRCVVRSLNQHRTTQEPFWYPIAQGAAVLCLKHFPADYTQPLQSAPRMQGTGPRRSVTRSRPHAPSSMASTSRLPAAASPPPPCPRNLPPAALCLLLLRPHSPLTALWLMPRWPRGPPQRLPRSRGALAAKQLAMQWHEAEARRPSCQQS